MMIDQSELTYRIANAAAAKRIVDDLKTPYEGYIGGRNGKYVVMRVEDVMALLKELKVLT